MKILVTGGQGQLGSEFAALHHPDLICLSKEDCDITNPISLQKEFSQYQPTCVINAAAYTAVDKAESDAAQAYLINHEGVANLAVICKQYQIPLIHFSTDYIFEGDKKTAYLEEDEAKPQGVYGESKWKGECALREIWEQHLIFRVSWVFGQYRQNFVKTILRLAREKETLKIVADQKGCPTSTRSMVEMVLKVCEQLDCRAPPAMTRWGTFHYCNGPATNWFEFAKAIIDRASQTETLTLKELIPITTAEYPTAAKRPANSVLNTDKIQKVFGILPPPWQDELDRLFTLENFK